MTILPFAQRFIAYLRLWPAVAIDIKGRRPDDYAEHLLRIAREVASRYHWLDIGNGEDCPLLEDTLTYTMLKYKVSLGTFDSLFKRNLKERVRKEAARMVERAERQKEVKRQWSQRRAAAHDPIDEFTRWAKRLLHQATERLDHATKTYFLMDSDGAQTADIAIALGLPVRTVINRFRPERVHDRLRAALQKVILSLPERHLHLLWMHLLYKVGLKPQAAVELLGSPVVPESGVPVLEEEELLAVLGWRDEEE